jgi:RimJ/RimL family protein N-acetyltransferase
MEWLAFSPGACAVKAHSFQGPAVVRARQICRVWKSSFDVLQAALMSITTRILAPQDWKTFRQIRLRALREHPDVYTGSYKETAARTESEWMELLDGKEKCIFGLFDGDSIIGLAAVFRSREDPSGQSGVLAMDYIDPLYRGRRLSRILYQARIDWAKQHRPFRRLLISHREGNEASRRANQSFGFKFIGKQQIDWPDGTKAPDYVYELDLATLRRS